jgi:hypothetical protein
MVLSEGPERARCLILIAPYGGASGMIHSGGEQDRQPAGAGAAQDRGRLAVTAGWSAVTASRCGGKEPMCLGQSVRYAAAPHLENPPINGGLLPRGVFGGPSRDSAARPAPPPRGRLAWAHEKAPGESPEGLAVTTLDSPQRLLLRAARIPGRNGCGDGLLDLPGLGGQNRLANRHRPAVRPAHIAERVPGPATTGEIVLMVLGPLAAFPVLGVLTTRLVAAVPHDSAVREGFRPVLQRPPKNVPSDHPAVTRLPRSGRAELRVPGIGDGTGPVMAPGNARVNLGPVPVHRHGIRDQLCPRHGRAGGHRFAPWLFPVACWRGRLATGVVGAVSIRSTTGAESWSNSGCQR